MTGVASQQTPVAGPRDHVSVVITTHDRDDYLTAALKSLRAQTTPLKDIVVIDDGGSGSARAVATAYGARYFWQANAGQQQARNTGVANAMGNWVAFLDDDDLWLPDRHRIILDLAVGQEIDLIVGNFMFVNEKGQLSSPRDQFQILTRANPGFWDGYRPDEPIHATVVGKFPPMRMFPANPFWPSTLVIRRDLYEQIGPWDTRLRGVRTEDFDFAFRAVRDGRMGVIWKPTLYYRQHTGNHSNSHKVVWSGRAAVWTHLAKCQSFSPEDRQMVERHITEAYRAALYAAYGERDFKTVLSLAPKVGVLKLGMADLARTLLALLLLVTGQGRRNKTPS